MKGGGAVRNRQMPAADAETLEDAMASGLSSDSGRNAGTREPLHAGGRAIVPELPCAGGRMHAGFIHNCGHPPGLRGRILA